MKRPTSPALTAPFPWFGGKRSHAGEVWSRFGAPHVYAEPFAGSLAVLLACPTPAAHEIACDRDGMVCNFWRAITWAPQDVVRYADWPTFHQDLRARHLWLLAWARENRDRIAEDATYFDAQAAGWWVWGRCIWIGEGWCIEPKEGRKVHDPIPKASGQTNIALRDVPFGMQAAALARRLRRVTVLGRDWKSAVTPAVLQATPSKEGLGINRCVFLDPPYKQHGEGWSLYASDVDGTTDDVAAEAHAWALEHGELYRIAYCCQEGDFEFPADWHISIRDFGGYRNQGTRRDEKLKDMIAFSPSCINEDSQKALL